VEGEAAREGDILSRQPSAGGPSRDLGQEGLCLRGGEKADCALPQVRLRNKVHVTVCPEQPPYIWTTARPSPAPNVDVAQPDADLNLPQQPSWKMPNPGIVSKF
jgi:hypothetical protein